MTLNEALAIINSRQGGRKGGTYFLVCGFEPLHLASFFQARLLERLPADPGVEVQRGTYGDLQGNLEAARLSSAVAAAAVVEWSDVDPRLGLRSSGGWSNHAKADLASSCSASFGRLETAIVALAGRMPVAVAPPSLPLPPIGHTIRAQSSEFELELRRQLADFLRRISRASGVRVLERSVVQTTAPCLDARMELLAGFPYSIPFASALAGALVNVLCQPVPKKGLITDLDGTLWSGIAGECGPDGVAWSLEGHAQAHGLYQQMLGHLAGCGVLLGVCSKNEEATAEAVLARKDLFLDPESFFPICANWGPKSASVTRVLKAWNVAADSVVFVDDNPMELDEVGRIHQGLTCLRFPAKDPAAVWRLLGDLRDLFGKPSLSVEDDLRTASIRAAMPIQQTAAPAGSPDHLTTLQGAVTLAWCAEPADLRPLELINKTNQFNLNGARITEGEWRRLLERRDTLLGVVSYEDKFGPLGKIAVVIGRRDGASVRVSHWVMSCRAFSRRIEHHTIDGLLRHTGAAEVELAFAATGRNQPLLEFLRAVGAGPGPDGSCRISRAGFESSCGALPHQIKTQSGRDAKGK